jgi:plasmid stability protein
MSKMIQIRNVPDDLHAQLKRRAAESGKTLSDYLLEEIREYATKPTMREWLDEVATLEPVVLGDETTAEAIHAERERR